MSLTKEQLEGKTPEQILELHNQDVAELKAEAEKQMGIAKEAIQKRDSIKDELRTLKERGNTDEATKTKISELEGKLTEANTNITNFKTEIDSLKTKQTEAEAKATALETKTKESLIDKLPDSHKEFAKKLSLTDLEEYVRLNSKDKNMNTDENRTVPAEFFTGKKWDDLNIVERDKLYKTNPALYNKLYNERNKK